MRSYTVDTFPATLDAHAVNALPVAKLHADWRVSPGAGMGCAFDAPGYPSYFLRAVYNRGGNTPQSAPDAVLLGTDGEWHRFDVTCTYDTTTKTSSDDRAEKLQALYVPLPIEHPRVQAWIASVMAHFKTCYADAERPEYNRPGTLVYSNGSVPAYKLKTFRDDPRWSEEYRAAHKAEIEAYNRQENERAARIATVDNHRGVRAIRKVYPDWTPRDLSILGGIPGYTPANWWTTDDAPPAPESCPGDVNVRMPHTERHCQWCGMWDGKIWAPDGLL